MKHNELESKTFTDELAWMSDEMFPKLSNKFSLVDLSLTSALQLAETGGSWAPWGRRAFPQIQKPHSCSGHVQHDKLLQQNRCVWVGSFFWSCNCYYNEIFLDVFFQPESEQDVIFMGGDDAS